MPLNGMAGHPKAFCTFQKQEDSCSSALSDAGQGWLALRKAWPWAHPTACSICRDRPGDPAHYTNCIQTLRQQYRECLHSTPPPVTAPYPPPTSAGLAGICAEDEVVPWPALLAPSAHPRAAAGGHFPLSPLASLDQKPLLLDPGLGPPDLAAPAARCLCLLEGWGPASPSAQKVLQVLRACQHFFLKYSSILEI